MPCLDLLVFVQTLQYSPEAIIKADGISGCCFSFVILLQHGLVVSRWKHGCVDAPHEIVLNKRGELGCIRFPGLFVLDPIRTLLEIRKGFGTQRGGVTDTLEFQLSARFGFETLSTHTVVAAFSTFACGLVLGAANVLLLILLHPSGVLAVVTYGLSHMAIL